MCWESEAEEKGVAVAEHISANVKEGDKIRVIAQDEESIYGPHSFNLGEIVEFLWMASDGKGVEAENEDGGIQTLMPHEWELASTEAASVRESLKVGDKVRVVARNMDSRYEEHHLEVGGEYEFSHLHPDGTGIRVKYEGWWGPYQILEPSEWVLAVKAEEPKALVLAKVGDTLRVIIAGAGSVYEAALNVGDIVTVLEVDEDAEDYYVKDENGDAWWIAAEETEPYLAAPKKGDTVRIITQHLTEPRTQREDGKDRVRWHSFALGALAEVTAVFDEGRIDAVVGSVYQTLRKDDYEPLTSDLALSVAPTPIVEKPKVQVGSRVKVVQNLDGADGAHHYPLGRVVEVEVVYSNGDVSAYGLDGEGETLRQTLEKAEYEVTTEGLTSAEPTGPEIKRGARIGDKVKVLTDGSEPRDVSPRYVGYHEYDSGDVVTVVDVFGGSEEALGEIEVHRSDDKPSWDTQILHSGDYELLEEEEGTPTTQAVVAKEAVQTFNASELLSPAQVSELASHLAVTTLKMGIDTKDFPRFIKSVEAVLASAARDMDGKGHTPELVAYLES